MSHTAIETSPHGIRLPERLWAKVSELARYTGGGATGAIEMLVSKYIDAELDAAKHRQPSMFGDDE